jgi:alanine racemase
VCMDQLIVDLGDVAAAAGDEIVLIGEQNTPSAGGRVVVSADDWARWLGTINYEIVCGVGRRVPRVYVGTAGRED